MCRTLIKKRVLLFIAQGVTSVIASASHGLQYRSICDNSVTFRLPKTQETSSHRTSDSRKKLVIRDLKQNDAAVERRWSHIQICIQFHGSQSRAFSRERSTQSPPRCQGSDRNKLHGVRSLFNFLLLKI